MAKSRRIVTASYACGYWMQPVLFEPVSADHTCELHTPTIPANHSVEVALSTAFGLSHKRKHTAEGVRLIVTQSRTSACDPDTGVWTSRSPTP